MPPAAAIAGAAVVGAGASIITGNKAAKTSRQNAEANNQILTSQNNQNASTLAPYIQRGNEAGGLIQGLINGGRGADDAFAKFREGAGYQTTLAESLGSLNSNAYARGVGNSGATFKALQDRAGQVAQGSFGQYASLLGNQQGVGLSAASAQAGVGQNYANNITASNTNAANVSANAQLNTGGQINGLLQNLINANAYGQGSYGSSYGGGR